MNQLDLIDNYLREKKAFNLTINPLNRIEAQSLSFSQQVCYWASRSYRLQNWKDNAERLTLILQNMPRTASPKAALQDPTVKLVRKFLKLTPKEFASELAREPNIIACQKALLAARLSITTQILDQNPGFQRFVEESRLYNYLEKYNHQLQVNEATNEIFILRKNHYVSWSSIPAAYKEFPAPDTLPYQAWKYGRNGLKNKNLYDWDTLKPFLIENPAEWGNRYRLSLCTTTVDRPRTKAGDHSYIRLYDGETGAIYAFGLYRPDKSLDASPNEDPLRVKPGYLMKVDVSEFWGVPIQEITAQITKQQFEQIKAQVEHDKTREIRHIASPIKRNDVLTFQLMEDNCTAYATRIAALAGIHLPVETTFYHIILPHKLMRVVDIISEYLPEFCLKVFRAIFGFFGNLIEIYYGATIVDAALLAEANVSPSIKPWSCDLFNPRKMINHSPFVLGQITRKKVESWRLGETRELRNQLRFLAPGSVRYNEIMTQIEDLKYRLPPENLR